MRWLKLPVIFLSVIVGIQLAIALALNHFKPVEAPRAHHPIPEPRLQIDERADLKKYRDKQKRLLGSYGWIDQKKKIAHIPIEQAIEALQ